MRELVFVLEHEPGCNRVADALAEYPDARIRSLSLHATTESLWRVDHVSGSADALAAIEEAFLATNHYTDCISSDHCDASQRTRVLESTDETLITVIGERSAVATARELLDPEDAGQSVPETPPP
jgi:hypothetical protein